MKPSPELIGFTAALRDTEQMKLAAEERARTTERHPLSERMAAIGTLSAGIGHDLGNLLLPLDIRVGLLLSGELSPELRQHVIGIQACAQYLQRISNGLRLLAFDPSGAGAHEVTELGAWWSDAEMMLKNIVPRGVRFEHQLPATECWLAIGRARLTQAMFNLVQNAADCVRERATRRIVVTVKDDPAESEVTMRVTDDGAGMTEEVTLVVPRAVRQRQGQESAGQESALPLAAVHLKDARMRSFIRGELRALGFDVQKAGKGGERVPSVIVADPAALHRFVGAESTRRSRLIVIGDSPPAGSLPFDEIIALGPNPDPEAIGQALRRAAEKTNGPAA